MYRTIILILSLFAVISCRSVNPEKAVVDYHSAMDILKKGDLDSAFMLLNQAIEADPEMHKAYYSRAAIFNTYKGQKQNAINDLVETVRLKPDFAPAYHLLGRIYIDTADYINAAESFTKAIAIEPDIKEHYYFRGKANLEIKKFNEALDDFEKAISIDPHFAPALLEAGHSYLKIGKPFDAIKALDSAEFYGASKIDRTYEYRGLSYYFVNNYEAALKDFSNACKLNPNNTTALFNRANVNSLLGNLEEAIEDFTANIALESDNALLYFSRGNRYHLKKKYYLAISDFEKALELKPGYEEAYLNMAYSQFAIGNITLTEKYLDSAIITNPGYNEALEMKGMLLRETNRPNESFKLLEKSIERDPDYPLFYFELALTWDSILLHDKAIDSMETFLEKSAKMARLRGKYKEGKRLIELWKKKYKAE